MSATDDRTPPPDADRPDAEYSATVLGSQWVQRPTVHDTRVAETPSPTVHDTPVAETPSPTAPDRVEGTVLRFGPGVTAALAHRTLPVVTVPPAPPRRRWRRHALPALVLLCVLAFLAWQRLGPSVEVDAVTVTSRPAVLGCDGTADVVGVVRTNGRPGRLTYRWVRSDGTASGVLREEVVRGQKHARLHLLWTFEGPGQRTARAELQILSPTREAASARFTYACP
ncbi:MULTISPECIES: hypothetical protein [unclassified Streptomyces]|uniref:hypothetical protein n=1 Tax=unclassified Streptomyces TaxID=2593676 RepID=UPI0016621BD9|nr:MULTISPECIES: hypothetical protein [unclassified Streptomyces]MBD0839481.1 hypothetical protein [Streptomyces sp. TRM68416]